jgi:hypothetical protein
MISTGPGREETIFTDEFSSEMKMLAEPKSRAQAKK